MRIIFHFRKAIERCYYIISGLFHDLFSVKEHFRFLYIYFCMLRTGICYVAYVIITLVIIKYSNYLSIQSAVSFIK